ARGRSGLGSGDRHDPAGTGQSRRQLDDPGRAVMRAPRQLTVLLGGDHVAMLDRTRSTLRLRYLDGARSPDATPLSLALPPSLGSHTGRSVGAYLDGLIPDSDAALEAIRRQYGADPRDRMSVLAAIGK